MLLQVVVIEWRIKSRERVAEFRNEIMKLSLERTRVCLSDLMLDRALIASKILDFVGNMDAFWTLIYHLT